MSRAFVREADGADDFEDLPDKLISSHRNLVTVAGLALIEAEVERLQGAHGAAQAENDRGAIARAARDLRYWSERRRSAEVMPPPADADTVQFGSKVSLERDDGRQQTFRIVGEDEADPKAGTVSYASPLAQALMGKRIGDAVMAGATDATIIAIAR